MAKTPKHPFKKYLVFLLSALAGGAVGFFLLPVLLDAPSDTPAKAAVPAPIKLLLVLPTVALAYFFAIAAHELGHRFAGKLVGFQFRLLAVGPLMWQVEDNRLRFKWNRNLNVMGGLALCLPTDDRNLVRRFAVFTAGGPVASLLFAGFCYLGKQLLVPAGPPVLAHTLEKIWVMAFVFSILAFLLSAIPMHTGGFYSDGARLLHFLKGGTIARLDVLVLNAATKSYAGVRPRHLRAELLLEGVALPVQSSFKAYLHEYLYLHYLDTGNLEAAAHHLAAFTQAIEELPKGLQAVVHLENAWFAARFRGDAEVARQHRQQAVLGAIIPKTSVHRADAAIALAEGNIAKAIQEAEAGLAAVPKALDRGSAIAEKEWLEALIAEATQPAEAQPHMHQPQPA